MDPAKTDFFSDLITMSELLDLLKRQYSRWTIYTWVRTGMPVRKIRGKLWFPRTEVLRWLEETSSRANAPTRGEMNE